MTYESHQPGMDSGTTPEISALIFKTALDSLFQQYLCLHLQLHALKKLSSLSLLIFLLCVHLSSLHMQYYLHSEGSKMYGALF